MIWMWIAIGAWFSREYGSWAVWLAIIVTAVLEVWFSPVVQAFLRGLAS